MFSNELFINNYDKKFPKTKSITVQVMAIHRKITQIKAST